MLKKINLTHDEAVNVMKASFFPDTNINVTIDSIKKELESGTIYNAGLLVKNFIKKSYECRFGSSSPEFSEAQKCVMMNSDKTENFTIMCEKIFIDGIGYNGAVFVEDEPENNTVVAISEPEKYAETPDFSDDENIYYARQDEEEQAEATAEPEPAEIINEFAQPDVTEDDKVFEDYSSDAVDESIPLHADKENEQNIPDEYETAEFVWKKPENLFMAQELVDKLVSNNMITFVEDDSNITYDSSYDNIVYEDCDIFAEDNIVVSIYHENKKIDTDFFVITSMNNRVTIIGTLLEGKDFSEYHIEASAQNINFDILFESGLNYNIIWTDKEHENFYCGNIELSAENITISDKTLCIDFGTSNTTAGIVKDKTLCTAGFIDTTTNGHICRKMCPTVAYINKITTSRLLREPEVEYVFGYDAMKVLIDNDYNPAGDMIFEMKRWITTVKKPEKISDGKTVAKIERRSIISAYLKYILSSAESYFKCKFRKLHFSAPVKLKNDFISFVQNEVFKKQDGFSVVSPSESIDEGIAIIYDHISQKIINSVKSAENPDAETSENILIIDCGGSTTDLASCYYSYKRSETGFNLTLRTKFENGNSNFGGNNLTYRIFQLLKIKLADYYKNNASTEAMNIELNDLISLNQNEIFDEVDMCIKNSVPMTIYNRLDERSKACEEILPTDFNGKTWSNHSKDRNLVRRNFYYLWQLAEKLKIKFFSKSDVVYVSFLDSPESHTIQIDTKNLYFYIRNPEGNLPILKATCDIPALRPLPRISVDINEINSLLRPDIYYLLASVLRADPLEYDTIKLSGQSCMINLFRDLLKEFVPGYKLRNGFLSTESEHASEKLKMNCVNGCVEYNNDRDFHLINATIVPENQNIIYDVKISRGNSSIMDNYLFRGSDYSYKNNMYVTKPIHIEQFDAVSGHINISVYNVSGITQLEQEFSYRLVVNISENEDDDIIFLDYTDTCDTRYNILKQQLCNYSYYNIDKYMVVDENNNPIDLNVVDDLIERIRNIDVKPDSKKLLVFSVPNTDGYGFVLYQIVKAVNSNGVAKYYQTSWEHTPFESAILSKSFFNGKNCEK